MLSMFKSLHRIPRKFFSGSTRDQILKIKNDFSNVSPKILDLVDKRIHEIEAHPLNTIKERMRNFFQNLDIEKSSYQNQIGNVRYEFIENNSPIGKQMENLAWDEFDIFYDF
jgi:hypothetical protein